MRDALAVGLLLAALLLQGCAQLNLSGVILGSGPSKARPAEVPEETTRADDLALIRAAAEVGDGPAQDGQSAAPTPSRRLEIRLATQKFVYWEKDTPVLSGPVSTGRRGYSTPTGRFRVLSKQRHKLSNRYSGSNGRPASMPYSIQFVGHYFIHQGSLPGYPASHGCVRLRKRDARFLFSRLRQGDPILIRR